jgi:hypothetical protein
MKDIKVFAVVVMFQVGFVGCTAPSILPKSEPLAGDAYLNAPLDSAKVIVETPSGTTLENSAGDTTFQGRFFKTILMDAPMAGEYAQWFDTYFPLTIKVAGGTVGGTAFDGTLLGYVDALSPQNNLHVNILTTLIVKYKLAAGVTLAQAKVIVNTALGIPAEMDLTTKMNDPNYWNYFNPTRFMALAQANGGFDAFTDRIVANIKTTRKPGFNFVRDNEAAPEIGSEYGKWIGENTASGLLAWGVGEFMGWMLDGFSTQNPTQQALNQIESELTTMNLELTAIQTGIKNLTNDIKQLLKAVDLEWSNLISHNDSLNMSNEETLIQNVYGTLINTYNATNPNVCTAAGSNAAMGFAGTILGTSANGDIDQQIYNMYAQMTGQVAGTNGALHDMTTQLIIQAHDGRDLLQCYYVLENYFGQLVATQAQGLDLMIEAIHETQNTNQPYADTATQYYNKYQGLINAETEIFLACVDHLVVSAVNVRSELVTTNFSYLPQNSEAQTIYSRADFVAGQLSSQQPSGLIVRLIGDPIQVTNWIANNQITANGTPLTVVSVNGNTTNNYTATIPASTPKIPYYLEWTANGGNYTFQQETNISVVKLQLSPAPTAPASFTVTSPTQSQTVPVAWYNIAFQQLSSPTNDPVSQQTNTTPVLYGSAVCFVRVLPTWQADNGVKTQDKKNQWTTTYSTTPADFSVYIQSVATNIDPWTTAPITYTGGLYTNLINGTTANVSLAFTWNAAQTTTNDWTNNLSGTGNQSLICQSTDQQAGNNTSTTTNTFTFTPNTNTTLNYQVQQVLTSMYSDGLADGDVFQTTANLNSVEVIPIPNSQ